MFVIKTDEFFLKNHNVDVMMSTNDDAVSVDKDNAAVDDDDNDVDVKVASSSNSDVNDHHLKGKKGLKTLLFSFICNQFLDDHQNSQVEVVIGKKLSKDEHIISELVMELNDELTKREQSSLRLPAFLVMMLFILLIVKAICKHLEGSIGIIGSLIINEVSELLSGWFLTIPVLMSFDDDQSNLQTLRGLNWNHWFPKKDHNQKSNM
ncbi:hypothetical protein FF38_09274 [Lucilia cuprina]|uniref:Uncharacterized protein n=1 Tax=Lucilia cuprina TaxID=7375 RepID=A0A0L0CFF3_LUCCU|nr:hypothetical protein FF38_09274 [Lucilia cuprina]